MARMIVRLVMAAALIATPLAALPFTAFSFAAWAQTQPAKPAPAKAQAAKPGHYPTAVVDAFIAGCGRESGGRTEFCRCLIDGLQKKLSFADFKRWETAGALGMQVQQTINEKVLDVATLCRWPD